jgi:hypothetical protein
MTAEGMVGAPTCSRWNYFFSRWRVHREKKVIRATFFHAGIIFLRWRKSWIWMFRGGWELN